MGDDTKTAFLKERVRQYGLLMRVDRPIGTLLLMWPTLWALWIAGEGQPSPFVTLVFVLGVFLMRSAGCVINDYADRDLDWLGAQAVVVRRSCSMISSGALRAARRKAASARS